MNAENPHVLDVEAQKDTVREIKDLDGYIDFSTAFFYDTRSSIWIKRVTTELSRPDFESMPPEYFRLLGFVGILFAQFGHTKLEGQISRHNGKGFKKSPLDPSHQLALACYGGSVNSQAQPIKERWSEELSTEDPDASIGAWGIMLIVNGGIVLPLNNTSSDWIKKDAKRRFKEPKPICLPDVELNRNLADIDFTGNDADELSDKKLKEVFPQARVAVADYVDLEPIFRRRNLAPGLT